MSKLLTLFSGQKSEQFSDSSFSSSQEKSTQDTTTTEDIQMDYGKATGLSIANVPEVKRAVVSVAVNHLLKSNHFSICKLDSILDIVRVSENSEAYKLLRTLHCIDYADMTQEVRDAIPKLLNEALRPREVNVVTENILDGVQF